MPKVSICIPTYMQEIYLRKTLDSILIQDYEDFELIITDDSPDDTIEQLLSNYNFDGKLKYYRNSYSLGSPENWNEAVRKASGEYIKMLHHDDFFTYSYSLREFVKLLESSNEVNFAFSASSVVRVNENKTWIHKASPTQLEALRTNPKILFFGNIIGAPSATIYRNLPQTEYDTSLKWVVDFDFYIRFLLKTRTFNFTDQPLISTISGANHNVTNICENNAEVELFEYLLLYNKIKKSPFIIQNDHFTFFRQLFAKYNIESLRDLRLIKQGMPVPFLLKIFLHMKQLRNAIRA
ncbi:glycosyltransferase family 2 protein [Flavitalea sp.]|nr:glycosyltransferase [Flavitalea sp.]